MRVLIALLYGAAVLLPVSASALPITVGFTGVISEFDAGAFPNQPAVQLGSTFTGSFTVDPDTIVETRPDSGFFGETRYRVTDISGSLDMEGTTFALYTQDSPATAVFVGDDLTYPPALPDPWDSWGTTVGISGSGPVIPNFGLSFRDSTGTKLTSDDFFVPQSLVGWDRAGVFFAFPDGGGGAARANGSFQTLFVIPEPSTLLLVGLGFGGLALKRRAT